MNNKLHHYIQYLKGLYSLGDSLEEVMIKVTFTDNDIRGISLRDFKLGIKELTQIAVSNKEIKSIKLH